MLSIENPAKTDEPQFDLDPLTLRFRDAAKERAYQIETVRTSIHFIRAYFVAGTLLYIAFGSHRDLDPYHGWVFAYEASSLKQKGVFCTTPGGGEGGIWQGGEGPVEDGKAVRQ